MDSSGSNSQRGTRGPTGTVSRIVSLLTILLLTSSVSLASVRPTSPAPASDRDTEVMVDERYDVEEGELLFIDVPDADVLIKTGSNNSAHVVISVQGRDMEKARRYYEEQKISVERASSSIRVVSERKRPKFNISWSDNAGAKILIEVTLPERFDLDVATSDGNVRAGRHVGTHSIRTSDGDIEIEALSGPTATVRTSDGDIRFGTVDSDDLHLRTSDGDVSVRELHSRTAELVTSDGSIRVDDVAGNARLRTSDGNIVVGRADDSSISLRTSDGSIKLGSLRSGEAEAQTSDGGIRVDVLVGSLDASTSDGDVFVALAGPSRVVVRAGDGDVVIEAPEDLAADLQLSGERVRLATDFAFRGRVQRTSAEGSINGGGELIRARASGGTVFVRSADGN